MHGKFTLRQKHPVDIDQHTVDYIEGLPVEMHASMHAEILVGRPLGQEALNGAVVRAGRSAGLQTPIHGVICTALKPFASRGET